VWLERKGSIGVFYVDTDRSNATNLDSVAEANRIMDEAEHDGAIRALVVTSSNGKMFCPGADLPTLMSYSRTDVRRFFESATALFRRKFLYPKPLVYALNGHAVAGGSLLPLAGDFRLMVDGPYRIGPMEIDVGLAAPAGIVELVRQVLGGHIADRVMLSGQTYSPQEALTLGMVDEVVERDSLMDRAIEWAYTFGNKPAEGYQRLKKYLRSGVAEQSRSLDEIYMDDLVDQWFEAETQQLLAAAAERLS